MPIISNTRRTIFSGDNLATTGFVYNSNASSGAEDGWIDTKYDNIYVQVGCATLTAPADVGIRIEGRFSTSGRAASLDAFVISAAGNIDQVREVTEKVRQIRVGAKLQSMVSTPLASPHNIYCYVGLSEGC